jgi:hypothetical protein
MALGSVALGGPPQAAATAIPSAAAEAPAQRGYPALDRPKPLAPITLRLTRARRGAPLDARPHGRSLEGNLAIARLQGRGVTGA